MSITKRTERWCKAATLAELQIRRAGLLDDLDRERNPMIRASMQSRLRIVEAELQRRAA